MGGSYVMCEGHEFWGAMGRMLWFDMSWLVNSWDFEFLGQEVVMMGGVRFDAVWF